MSSTVQLFQQLFGNFKAHTALLDLEGKIIAVNRSWNNFGHENGLVDGYEFEGRNYLTMCEIAVCESRYAIEAMIGLLDVINTGRPTFSMTYPCHSPSQHRWFRLWVESQSPHSPSIIVAHTLLNDYFDLAEVSDFPASRPTEIAYELLNMPSMVRAFPNLGRA